MSKFDQYEVGQCTPGVWKPERPISSTEQKGRDQLRDHMNAGLRLIVATKAQRNIGEVLNGTFASYVEGGRLSKPVWVEQPFVVRTAATFEEWIGNSPKWLPGRKPQKHEAAGYNFYELVTD
jgi:hypothetical protein